MSRLILTISFAGDELTHYITQSSDRQYSRSVCFHLFLNSEPKDDTVLIQRPCGILFCLLYSDSVIACLISVSGFLEIFHLFVEGFQRGDISPVWLRQIKLALHDKMYFNSWYE